jgi:predicted TIM-barrel fold metal-dependent hydrolase
VAPTDANPVATSGAPAPIPEMLIDMHCHVFNASDLPASTFIRRVVTKSFSAEPDALALLIGGVVSVLAGNAPTAAAELADISAGRETASAGMSHNNVLLASGNANLFEWAKLFGKSRRELIAKLSGFYAATNNRCELITPSLVDFSTWLLHPDTEERRLTDQVALMGAVSRLTGRPRVHGFVGFDPVRAILAAHGYNPAGGTALPVIDPHKLVREAVAKHGFLGVKLYPPMGFRAFNNGKGDITFSQNVKTYVAVALGKPDNQMTDKDLGERIDAELEKLYRYCADEGVPILAHAFNSNQAEACTGWRASPQYWGAVIDKFSTAEKPLHLCLGHFGSFDAHEQFKSCSDFSAKAWEVIIGGILAKAGGQFVFADLSYLSEVLDKSDGAQTRRNKIRDQFKSFVASNDPNVEHICYGSDWNMLGREPGHERYHITLGDFLRKDVGLDAIKLANIYSGNAIRFLGLRPGDKNRQRLEKFYQDNHIENYFPRIDPLIG